MQKSESCLNISLVQLDIAWESPSKNLEHVDNILNSSDLSAVDLIVLPEMFASGFTMNPESVATPRDGQVVSAMRDWARKHNAGILGSHVESVEEGFANVALMVGRNGEIVGEYRKIHPFGSEREHYVSGERLLIHDMGPFRAAVFICYDLRFPEIFRAAFSQGVNLFFVIASWPKVRHAHWKPLLAARAIENQAYVCGCNRVGSDPHNDFNGGSCVIVPDGQDAIELDASEQLRRVTLDIRNVQDFRNRLKCLEDRRPDLYQRL